MMQTGMRPIIDLLITNGRIRTLNAKDLIHDPGAIAVDEGRIAAIGPQGEITSQFTARQTWDARGKLIMPGFINTHAHLFQTFLRGLGKDLPLVDWLKASVRSHTPYLQEEDCYLAALVGCMDAIRSGTTTLLDYMYVTYNPMFYLAVGRAFADLGIRGILGRGFSNVGKFPDGQPNRNCETVDEGLEKIDALRIQYQDHPMISIAIAPPSFWTIDRPGLAAVAEYSKEYELLVTLHTYETDDDEEFCLEKFGQRPYEILSDLGMLNPRFIGVHCVKLKSEDIDLLAQTGAGVSHNPAANMVLASGVAPIPELLARGVKVGLATDGASSNDSHSIIEAMKLAALLQKVHHLDASALGARDLVRMVTAMGAKVVGKEDEIGSLEAGKRADLVVLDMMKVNTVPAHDEIANLVYCGSGANVDSVVINGRFVLLEGRFTTVNEGAVVQCAVDRARLLIERASIGGGLIR